MDKTIGILGGDLRYIYLVEEISGKVIFYGNEKLRTLEVKAEEINDLDTFINESHIIITSIPFSKDGEKIHAPFFEKEILVDKFFKEMIKNKLIIGGPFNEEIKSKYNVIDLTSRDDFKILNSIPTAEGVINKMIKELPITIYSSNVLVLGYGFCGKKISEYTRALGANTSILTLNKNEIYQSSKEKYRVLDDVNKVIIDDYDFVINTIPVKLINLNKANKNSFIFIDITNAYQYKENWFIKMRGIPGQYSPETSGKIIGSLVKTIIN